MNKINSIEENLLHSAKNFISESILPYTNEFSQNNRLPEDLIAKLAKLRFLGTLVAEEYSGLNISYSCYGKLTRMFGYACSSVRSLLTVHDMVAAAIQQFGNSTQKQEWLPSLANGKLIGAFALTEPQLGTAIDKIETTLEQRQSGLYLTGKKVWISYGLLANIFLVFAKLNDKAIAIIVPSDSPNIQITPIRNSLSMPASMLAEINFDGVAISSDQLLGQPGIGLNFIASRSLTLGRYSVACGCLGIIDACIHLAKKKVFAEKPAGSKLLDHQLICSMISEMLTNRKIVALLCKNAGEKLSKNFIDGLEDTMMAKFTAARLAYQTANDTFQIYGAEAYHESSPIRRYLHDARVCELIEGSNEAMRINIAKTFLGNYENVGNF